MNPSLAVQLAGKQHHFIVALFVVGYLLHAGLQVDAIARAKNNPLNSRMHVIAQNWIRMAARLFVSLMLFLWAWHNPSLVPTLLGYFGISLGAGAVAILTIPMSPPVSGIFGFASDSLLAYIPILKNALPAVDVAPNPPEASKS